MKTFVAMGIVLMVVVAAALAGDVELNGVEVPKAVTLIDVTQDVTEFRSGGDPAIRLVPGPKRYGVCVSTASRVPALDAELPLADTPDRFTVKSDDGREFGACLLASLKVEAPEAKRRYTYCLRCEDVTP